MKIKTKIINTADNIKIKQSELIPVPSKILENGLPDYYLIKTAFIKQSPKGDWSQPWQDACEEAALITVKDYYQQNNPSADQMSKDILDMIDFETQKTWGESINTSQMSEIGQNYLKYKTEIIDNPTIDQIKKYLTQNIPVIVPADGKILFQENKYFSNGGPYYHNLVILGYNENNKKFIVHDVGTQHGAYFQYSYKTMMDSIHDYPASNKKEDIQSGAKRVLVLLK